MRRTISRPKSETEPNKCNGSKSPDALGPYASVAISNDNHVVKQYESPHLINHLYNPTAIHVGENQPRRVQGVKYNGNAHKMSKDSGYYSCEFLNKSNNSSPPSNPTDSGRDITESGHREMAGQYGREGSGTCYSSFTAHLPPSDSGVFTLSRSYSRASRLAQSPPEGIYDNVL